MNPLKCIKIHTGFYFSCWIALMLYAAEIEKFSLIIPAMLPLILSLMGFKVIKEVSKWK